MSPLQTFVLFERTKDLYGQLVGSLFRSVYTLIVIIKCSEINTVQSFNIDTQYPIVIKNAFHGSNAHFGASITLLSVQTEDNNFVKNGPTGWVIIGAPKGNSTYINHTNINEPGVLWRCALGRYPEPHLGDCILLNMDPTDKYDPKNPDWAHQDKKDGAWIGGTMIAGDDRFVTCGSRWVNQKYDYNYLMNGICYWVPKGHIISDKVNVTWPWLPEKYSYRLSAFLKKNRQTVTVPNKNLPEDRGKKRFDWAFGQMGFSLSFGTNNREIIVGAPGVLEWTGTVVQFRDSKYTTEVHKRFNAHPRTPIFSEILIARIRHGDNESELNENDYFGYAVASGNFFDLKVSKNRTQYVAGAPRSSLSGKVLSFSFKETTEPQTADLDYLTEPIQLMDNDTASYTSYFGSALLALDINADAFDDLIVGAPHYRTAHSHHQLSVGSDNPSTNNGDEGCIFIYLSTGYEFDRSPQEICGDRVSGARFGSTLSALGDVNCDGYLDFAVGAPYENDNHGAVYIYHGGEQVTFAQKLQPESLDPGIRTFGYSLSSNDIDGNQYSDLAVGAYESNHVIVFRTIPLVNFSASLYMIPKVVSTTRDFNITSCISYSGRTVSDTLRIKIKLEILHPPNSKKLLSWVFHKSQVNSNVSNLLQPLLELEQLFYFPKEGSCHNFTALRIGELDDVAKSITIRETYWIDGYDKASSTEPIIYKISKDSNENPYLQYDSKPSFQSFRSKNPLPINNSLSTTESVLLVGSLCEEDGDPVCNADLRVKLLFQDSSENGASFGIGNVHVIGSSKNLTVDVQLGNFREIATLPISLDIKWASPPTLRKISSDCEKYENDNHHYLCHIKRALKQNDTETIQMQFDMTKVYGGEVGNSITFDMRATASELLQNATFRFELPLTMEMEVANYTHKYNMSFENSIMTDFNFSQAVEINLSGPTPTHAIRLQMSVPKYIELNGETHEFVLLRRPIVTYDGVYHCKAINGSFSDDPVTSRHANDGSNWLTTSRTVDYTNEENDDFLDNDTFYIPNENDYFQRPITSTEILKQKVSRLRRSSEATLRNFFHLDTEDDTVLKFACGETGVVCMKLTCDMKHFHDWSKAVIELKLRLKNTVTKLILKEHRDLTSLWFESRGTLKLVDARGIPFGSEAEVNVVTEIKLPEQFDIPMWILLISVAGGLLILFIVILILYKCGFFRRKKKEQLATWKSEQPKCSYGYGFD